MCFEGFVECELYIYSYQLIFCLVLFAFNFVNNISMNKTSTMVIINITTIACISLTFIPIFKS